MKQLLLVLAIALVALTSCSDNAGVQARGHMIYLNRVSGTSWVYPGTAFADNVPQHAIKGDTVQLDDMRAYQYFIIDSIVKAEVKP